METKGPVITDPTDLPWSKDAPEGLCWRCPDCGSRTILGGNAAYHAQVKHHSAPVLELDPSSPSAIPALSQPPFGSPAPCPFCGGAASAKRLAKLYLDSAFERVPERRGQEWAIVCGSCEAIGPQRKTRDEAANAWQGKPAPAVAVAVTPGRVVLNDLWLVVDRPEVKIITGDARTKHAEVMAYSGSTVYLGLTPRSVHGAEEGPELTEVAISGLPDPPDGAVWLIEAAFVRYTLTVFCWLETAASGTMLWRREGDE